MLSLFVRLAEEHRDDVISRADVVICIHGWDDTDVRYAFVKNVVKRLTETSYFRVSATPRHVQEI